MIDEYTSNPKGDFIMATAQQVIKNFMSYLDNTTESGETALNNAIRVCSKGICNTMQEAINYMVNDAASYGGNGNAFLVEKCGIVLYNDDTGSIVGSDAGSGVTYTSDSIIPEDTPYYDISRSQNSAVINGVTFSWDNPSSDLEAIIINAICSWYAKGALDLIERAYGITYTESGSMGKGIKINFVNSEENFLARANHKHVDINMRYYGGIDINDPNGSYWYNGYKYKSEALDRVFSHELTHSVMFAVINWRLVNTLPQFLTEGFAELTHGIDDDRTADIKYLAENPSMLQQALSIKNTGTGDRYCYSGGYMFLRYMAKQLADVVDNSPWKDPSTVTGVTLSGNNKLVMTDGYNDWLFDLNSYIWHDVVKNVSAIDASSMTNRVGIIGRNDRANTIIGGHGETQMLGGANQSDTLTGGSGTNIFWFGSNHGNDTITNFNSATDTLKLFDGVYGGCSTTGNDVIINSNNAAINLKNMANQKMRVELGDGIYNCIFANQSTENVFDFDKSINYFFGSNVKKDTIKAHTGDYWVDLNAAGCVNADVLDAKDVTDTVYLLGSNNNSMTIYGGQGHTEMLGGYGQNDTLVGGNSDNVFWFGTGYGNDIITNMDIDDTINLFTGNVTNFGITGNDYAIIMDNNNSITIQGGLKDGAKVSVASLNATFVYDSTVEGNWRNA